MRCHPSLADVLDKALRIGVLVSAHRQTTFTGSATEHLQRRVALGINHQRVPIVYQYVANITQAQRLTLGFVIQPGIGVGLAFVRI